MSIADQAENLMGGEERRKRQRKENERIGQDGWLDVPEVGTLTLNEALERFVFLSEGGFVYDRKNPTHILKLANWETTYAASMVKPPPCKGKGRPSGPIPVTKLWKTSPKRLTTFTATFRPGHGELTVNPHNLPSVNVWSEFDRSGAAVSAELFIDHVKYLFGEDSERFLDWLAHIEQEPGILPHTCWVHISEKTGTGRNWMASVLVRLWAGHVAPNLDLAGVLDGSFNDELAAKLMAVVDEIRVEDSSHKWSSGERFKRSVNPETRAINRKYGMKTIEWNVCRWLIFSNHIQAIPLDDSDRRVEVVICDKDPLGEAHYSKLYAQLGRPAFINGIAKFLRERDISKFNPGAHAAKGEAKKTLISVSKSDLQMKVEDLVSGWGADVITNAHLKSELQLLPAEMTAIKSILLRFGAKAYAHQVRVKGNKERCWVLMNHNYWLQQPREIVGIEANKVEIVANWRDVP